MSTFDEAKCMAYDPWAGDFTDYRVLSDKIVVARKAHEHCHVCDGPIAKGERHRSLREIVYGEGLRAYRFCGLCCAAMAKSWDDNGEEIDERTMLHPSMAAMRTGSKQAMKD